MTRWRKLLFAWAGCLPTRIIRHEDGPLFERSAVWSGRVPFIGEVTVYLHHYLRSDPDRGLHDHPWPWAVSIPLAGGYTEQRLASVGSILRTAYIRRLPFLPYRLTGDDFHRVILRQNGGGTGDTSWSLFITGPNRHKEWGFLRQHPAWPEGPARYQYTPHLEKDGSHTQWWRTAPLGRFHERAAP